MGLCAHCDHAEGYLDSSSVKEANVLHYHNLIFDEQILGYLGLVSMSLVDFVMCYVL